MQRQRFYTAVYALTRQVPAGRVTTYGAIARALGTPTWARQVGWALAALHTQNHDVPAYRVVNAAGALSGGWAFGEPAVQRALLEREGVRFDAQQRVLLERYFWQPSMPEPEA